MKQTSIEWLEMEIVKIEKDFAIPSKIYELCEQAKELHKQEIIEAYSEGDVNGIMNNEMRAEQYYNETYNK